MLPSPVESPSIFLPPLKALKSYSENDILRVIASLRCIYLPEVRGSNRRREIRARISSEREAIDAIRADAFERSFAIQWLTRLISFDSHSQEGLMQAEILKEATALLAICAGAAASGTVTRLFRFSLCGDTQEVLVTLQDAAFDPSDTSEGTSSVGMQTWGGSCVLAEMVAEHPAAFGILPYATRPSSLKVLELGAGTGLVSLILAKSLERLRCSSSFIEPDVVIATDFHPAVLANLRANYAANFPSQAESVQTETSPKPLRSSPQVHVFPLDWAAFHDKCRRNAGSIHEELPKPMREPFDLIIGADIIYEYSHAQWIRTCLEHFLQKPSLSQSSPLFHLIIPLRPTHTKESNSVEQVFPKAGSIDTSNPHTLQLAIDYQEDIICDAYTDHREGEEVVYRYYKIGWI